MKTERRSNDFEYGLDNSSGFVTNEALVLGKKGYDVTASVVRVED